MGETFEFTSEEKEIMGNVQILRIKNYKYSNIQRSVVERGKIVEKGRMMWMFVIVHFYVTFEETFF